MRLIPNATSFEECRDAFEWRIPSSFNIGVEVCTRHARVHPERPAIIYEDRDGGVRPFSFAALDQLSNQFANALDALDIARGDRVAVALPQSVECAASYIAIFKLGAVAMPLSVLFGPDALEYRLRDSGAKVFVGLRTGCEQVADLRSRLPELRVLVAADGPGPNYAHEFQSLVSRASDAFDPSDTHPDDPALLIYTSGTTGLAKGALHGHRVLLGHLPGVELALEFFPKADDRYWTPSDWSWIAGLINVLLCGLYHGVPIIARRFEKFDPEEAFAFLARHQVRNAFIPPTALKLMRQVPNPRRFGLRLRSACSGGEPLGGEILAWGQGAFGITINEIYGQTECNMVVNQCGAIMPTRAGATGRATPGHVVEIIDEQGGVLGTDRSGLIAVRRPDPAMFLEYWRNPQATRNKFIGDWLVTGDQGHKDEEGYFWFEGREDDLIKSAGYRLGPAEIEECLIKHPAVAMAGVVGKADEVRGEIVKAFVLLAEGYRPSDRLAREIQQFVRARLAAYSYPREVQFLDEMPLTVSGKVRRVELRRMG